MARADIPTASLLSVQVGTVAPLGPDRVPSAFVKHGLAGPVAVGPLGLEGDQQADPRVHGGPEKAVYAYAASHYPLWAADHPGLATLFTPGSMGENLTIAGLDETGICVGDVHAIGTALLQVCQPRQPCFKFALRFGDSKLPRAMVRNGRAGWYYRVLRAGVLSAGDAVTLEDRPNPDFAFPRLVDLVNAGDATPEELSRLLAMPGLAEELRATLRPAA